MYRYKRLTIRIVLFLLIFLVACGKKNKTDDEEIKVNFDIKGGIPEKIIIDSKDEVDSILNDIIKGESHLYMGNIPLSVINNLKENDKNKLSIYETQIGIWNFLLNPYPNKAPYQVKHENTIEFNPFAIKELRFALNYLIDREFMTKELLQGSGGVNLSPLMEGAPNAWMFEFQANNMGINSKANKDKAIKDITSAMEKAANLPENKNRLVKKNKVWYFDDKVIKINFVINKDYSEDRAKIGTYLISLLEEAGIKSDKISFSTEEINNNIYNKNPEELTWQVLTERSKSKNLEYWQDKNILKNAVSSLGHLPGWGNNSWWNYKNPEIENLAGEFLEGKIENTDIYWQNLLKINELLLKDAIRIHTVYEKGYFVANKEVFSRSLYYTPYEGLTRNALENAYVNKKELKVIGTLPKTLSSWNPFNKNNLDDFSKNIIQMVFDKDIVQKPFGTLKEKRVAVASSQVDPIFKREANNIQITGNILIDKDATFYKESTTAAVKTEFKLNYGYWHHGRKVTKADYIYKENLERNSLNIRANSLVASKWQGDNLIYWYNGFSPKGGLEAIVDLGIPSLELNSYSLPWELMEAIQKLVIEGSTSGKKYSYIKVDDKEEIDLKSPSFIKDLKEKLREFSKLSYIPSSLAGNISGQEAKENYEKTIKFLDTYGHGLIGNGPYILSKLDTKSASGELSAIRDKDYTEEQGKWAKIFRSSRMIIDDIELPKTIRTGEGLSIKIKASEHSYPKNVVRKTLSGGIYALIVNENTNVRVDALNTGEGEFEMMLDSESTKAFRGKYKLVIVATVNGQYYNTQIREIIFE